MCPIKSTNYKPGLKVTTNAYDATNNANTVTSSEYFDFNEVGIYDIQTNTWLDLTEEQLNDPEVIKQYSDDSRYAMALGSDMNNIDGFMNMDSYIDEKGIEENSGPNNAYMKNAEIHEKQYNPDISSSNEIKTEGLQQLDETISKQKYSMGLGEERLTNFNGHQARIHKYIDGSSTIYYKDSNGSDVWYRYDQSNNLTDIQVRSNNNSVYYDANGNIKSQQNTYTNTTQSNRPI